ncbi:MAG: hypothetical protein HYT90_02535 [Candidatus Omnitrophica bacterium]|nr:hypothetical protein [Candidatus Omnitrophota bacterium]
MKRWVLGIICGVALASAAQGQEEAAPLTEAPMETIGRAAFSVPKGYGRLAAIVESSEIHHLYFEDGQGTVRVVLIGPRGAAARARNALQLLSSDVYVIERGLGAVEVVPSGEE